MIHRLTVIFVILLFMGCAAANAPKSTMVDGKPHWYWKPSCDGAIGGVGEAGFNVNGASAQRQLAIARAIEDIALQKGVTVKNIQSIAHNADSSGKSFTNLESYSVHTIDGQTVRAQVREIWKDPQTGRLVAWVVEVK